MEPVDLRLKHSTCCQLVGNSGSGKTTLALDIALNREKVYDTHFDKCIYYYKYNQTKCFSEVNKRDEEILFLDDQEEIDLELKDSDTSLLILDDLLVEPTAKNNRYIESLFLGASHHSQITVVFQSQLLYPKEGRSWSLNTSYFVLLRSFRQSQMDHFFRSINSKLAKFFHDSYEFCTQREKYGHFFLSFHPSTPENLRYRSSIIPGPNTLILMPKKNDRENY